MPEKIRLGIQGLALSHPIMFLDWLTQNGYVLSALQYDEKQEEERERYDYLIKKYPDLVVVKNAQEMIEEGIDAVICSTQAHLHYENTKLLIEKKMPLFIDKPLAPNYQEAMKILNLIEEYDAPVMSCSIRRYSSNYKAIKEHLHRIGEMVIIECSEPNHALKPGYWQIVKEFSGGLAINYGIHLIDPIIEMFGTKVVSVYACGSNKIKQNIQCEDTFTFCLKYQNGLLVNGKVSGVCKHEKANDTYFKVYGEKGIIETSLANSNIQIASSSQSSIIHCGNCDGMIETMQKFDTMIKVSKRPISIDSMDATMKILDAIRRSIDTGESIKLSN